MTIKPGALGHQLYEYLLVIDLPADLEQRIETERQQLTDNYGILQPQTGRPNVSLVRFKAIKVAETKIINQLQLLAMAEMPFLVALNGFYGYPMHAMFIQIENQPKVLELIKNLKKARPLMKAAGDEPHFLLDPQIALAGRLPKDKYMEIMKEYEHKKFKGTFYVYSFLLLRRAENEQRYQLVKRLEFECLPVIKKQGVLF